MGKGRRTIDLLTFERLETIGRPSGKEGEIVKIFLSQLVLPRCSCFSGYPRIRSF